MRALIVILACACGLTAAASSARAQARTATDSLSAAVDPLFSAGEYDSILTILPGFISRAQARGDSVLLGRAITQRGRVRLMQGERASAIADIDAGIAIAEAVRDTTGLMPAVHFRGFTYSGAGDWDNAMRCFQRRLDLALRVRSPLDEGWARSGIAYVHHQRGRTDDARREYRRSIEIFQRAGALRLELNPLIGLGRVEHAAGNTPAAIECYQRAWVVSRETGDRLNEMWATNNLGVLEETTGDPARAAAYERRAYEIARGLKHPQGMVVPAINLAKRAVELGDFARADEILRETRALCLEKSEHYYLDVVDFTIADLRIDEDRHAEAAVILRRLLTPLDRLDAQHRDQAILAYARALAAADSAQTAAAWLERRIADRDLTYAGETDHGMLQIASVFGRAGRLDRAEALAARAAELAQRNGTGRLASAARLQQSIYLRRLGRPAAATGALQAAVSELERFRGGISQVEWREVWGQEISHDVLEASRVLLEYPDSLDQAARTRAFFDAVQRFKTRTLLDRIGNRGDVPGASGALAVPATLATLQASLRPGELVLDLFEGRGESFMFAVTADSCRVVELPGAGSPLAERVDLFRHIVSSADPGVRADYPPARVATMQRALGRELLGGARDLVTASERVFVSPDGFYQRVPFSILDAGDGAPVIERRDVLVVPSAGVLVRERLRPAPACPSVRVVTLAAEGATDLAGARDEVSLLARRYRGVDRVSGIAAGDSLGGLLRPCDVLHVAAHALVVDRSPWDSGILLGRGVARGESGAPVTRGGPSTILSAADSMLVANAFPDDPYLRAWRIASMSIPARLAVLAACETGGGRATSGEGTLGITAAFLGAGVPVVVSSLWPVDDRETGRVMARFYRRLADGETIAAALRGAQLDVSRTPQGAHPFYWAGFVVVGDGDATVALESRRDWRPLALLAVILFLLALAVRRRRARARMR